MDRYFCYLFISKKKPIQENIKISDTSNTFNSILVSDVFILFY